MEELRKEFFEYLNEPYVDKDKILAYPFTKLIILKKDQPDRGLEYYIDLLVDYLKEVARIYDFSATSLEPFYFNYVGINKEITKYYDTLDENEKNLYCKRLFDEKLLYILGQTFSESVDVDFRTIFMNSIRNNRLTSEEINYFTGFIYDLLISKFLNSDQQLIPRTQIFLKKIQYNQTRTLPCCVIDNLNKINIFIGKNNQSKSRFLRLIKEILHIFQNFNLYKQGSKDLSLDDTELKEIFETEIQIDLELFEDIQTESKEFFWGWEFPLYEQHFRRIKIIISRESTESLEILEDGSMQPIPISEIRKILMYNIKTIYLDELTTIDNVEKFPDDGWKNYDIKNALDNLKTNFRGIINYYDWLVEEKYKGDPDFLKNSIFPPSIYSNSQKIIDLIKNYIKNNLIKQIFKLSPDSTEFAYISRSALTLFAPYDKQFNIASSILEENAIGFFSYHDKDINQLKLMIQGSEYEGEDISKQGHGIRTIALTLLSSIFCSHMLMDEPENGLHISLQKDLANYLDSLRDSQVFIVTHSPSIIPHSGDCSIFLIDKKKISRKILFPEKYPEDYSLTRKNMRVMRKILGISPEYLLFEKAIIYFEGKTDTSLFSKIFMPFNIKIEDVKGVDNLKKGWRAYSKILKENILEKIVFLFDGDYFNNLLAETDNINAFVLPCYSIENLLLDPYLLSNLIQIPPEIINIKLIEIFKNDKEKTLDKLFVSHLFRNFESNAKNCLQDLKEKKINWEVINEDFFYGDLYKFWIEEKRNVNNGRENVMEAIQAVQKIFNDWNNQCFRRVRLEKKQVRKILDQIYNECVPDEQKVSVEKPTKGRIKDLFIEIVINNLRNDEIPASLTKDFILLTRKILNVLNII